MAQYKVIAYSATIGKKVFKAHSIVDEKEFTEERLSELLKGGFIIPWNEEEELKAQIKAEEDLKKAEKEKKKAEKENKNEGA